MDTTAEIKPIKSIEYKCKQPKFEFMGSLPSRSVFLGPSSSGKTTVIANLILNHYRGCFEKIYIWSPTMSVDTRWNSIKEYCKKELNQVESKHEKYYFDTYITR